MDIIVINQAAAKVKRKLEKSGAVLPVVELSTVPTVEGAALTAEESAKMDEVATAGGPIVVRFTDPAAGQICGVFYFIAIAGFSGFVIMMAGNIQITIAKPESGDWLFMKAE